MRPLTSLEFNLLRFFFTPRPGFDPLELRADGIVAAQLFKAYEMLIHRGLIFARKVFDASGREYHGLLVGATDLGRYMVWENHDRMANGSAEQHNFTVHCQNE